MTDFACAQHSDVLFLIVKYLKQFGSTHDVLPQLIEKLKEDGAFGGIVGWDGTLKLSGMEEMEKKFPAVPSSHIVTLLKYDSSGPFNASTTPGKSLLTTAGSSNGDSDPVRTAQVVDLMRQWSSLLGKHLQLKQTIGYLGQRIELLSLRLSLGHNDDDEAIDLTLECSGGNNIAFQSTLQDIGRSKQLQSLNLELMDMRLSEEICANEEKPTVLNLLRKGKILESSLRLGKVSCGLDWLNSKCLGFQQTANSQHHRALMASNTVSTMSHQFNFKKQWTISGHMMNPAYCSVFDQTGNFILSGADDYLVKIWDVHRGVLVRSCKGHLAYITFIAVSADNSIFASSCTSGSIRIWRMCDGICLTVLKHESTVNWIKFDLGTFALVSGGDDGRCIVWDLSKILNTETSYLPQLVAVKQARLGSRSAAVSDVETSEVPSSTSFQSNPALFEWSRVSSQSFPSSSSALDRNATAESFEQCCKLIFPVIRNVENYDPQGEVPIRVLCLDISYVGGVIVTGSDDGVARIWRFDNAENVDHRYPSRSRRFGETAGSSKKSFLNSAQQAMLDNFEKYLLLRLEGHVSAVTDVHFNSFGDRVVTGSTQDGTVRIWSLHKAYSESIQLVLDLSEEDSVTVPSGVRKSTPGSRLRAKVKVHNICWTCNDARIVTVQSVAASETILESMQTTRLKVWDAMNGDLLRVIWSISDKPSKCLARHPTNPSVVVTAGEDGVVNVWDIELEANLATVQVRLEDGVAANLVDISINRDGTRIAATDMQGFVTLISTDNPERFSKHKYPEQYFSTDYTDIIHDADGFAIDVGSQMSVNDAPKGLLCRIDGSAYEHQPMRPPAPPVLEVEEVERFLASLKEDRSSLYREMDRVFEVFLRNKRTNRLAIKYRSSRVKSSRETTSKKPLPSAMPPSSLNYRDWNEALPISSDDSALDSDFEHEPEHHSGSRSRQLRQRRSSTGSLRRSTRSTAAYPVYDTYDDDDDEDDEEYEEDDDAVQPAVSKRRARQQKFAFEDDDELHDSDEDIGGRGRKGTNYADDGDYRQSSSRKKRASVRKGKQRIERKRSSRSLGQRLYSRVEWSKDSSTGLVLSVPPGTEIYRSWVQNDMQYDMSYVPQMGDRVMYIPQGHSPYLAKFAEDRSPPWMQFANKWPFVECEIRDIQYSFPQLKDYHTCHSIVLIVTLALVGTPTRREFRASQYITNMGYVPSTRAQHHEQRFEVALRNCEFPDFLVPKVLFERALHMQWYPNLRIAVHFKEKNDLGETTFREYAGTLAYFGNRTADWPQSPWEALAVIWDPEDNVSGAHTTNSSSNGVSNAQMPQQVGDDYVSLWEAIPQHADSESRFSRFKLPTINQTEAVRIANEIEALLEFNERFHPFHFEPDPEEYAEYGNLVPVPITLDLVCRRLRNGYYRQMESLDHDLDQIVKNCKLFNAPNSEIIAIALEMRDLLSRIVYQDSFPVEASNSSSNRKRERADTVSGGRRNHNGTVHEEDHESDSQVQKRARHTNRSSRKSNDGDDDNNYEAADDFEDLDITEEDYNQDEHNQDLQPVLRLSTRSSSRKEASGEGSLKIKLVTENRRSTRSAVDDSLALVVGNPTSHRKTRSNRKQAVESDDDADDDDDDDASEEDEEEDADEDSEDDDDDDSADYGRIKRNRKPQQTRFRTRAVTSLKIAALSKGKKTAHSADEEDDDEEEDEEEDQPRSRRSTRNGTTAHSSSIASRSHSRRMNQQKDDSVMTTRGGRVTKSIDYSQSFNEKYEEEDDDHDDEEEEVPRAPSSRNKGRAKQEEAIATSSLNRRSTRGAPQYAEDSDDDDFEEVTDKRSTRSRSHSSYQATAAQEVEPRRSSRYHASSNQPSDSLHVVNPRSRASSSSAYNSRSEVPSTRSHNPFDDSGDEEIPTSVPNHRRPVASAVPTNSRGTPQRRVTNSFNQQSHLVTTVASSSVATRASSSTSGTERRRLSAETKKLMHELVEYAASLDKKSYFAFPITDEVAPEYSNIISHPMDHGTVGSKLRRLEYSTLEDLLRDLFLIYYNCLTYNDPGSVYGREASRQREALLKRLKALRIPQDTLELCAAYAVDPC